MKGFTFFFTGALAILQVAASAQGWNEALTQYIDGARQGTHHPIPAAVIKAKDSRAVLAQLDKLHSDTLARVRAAANAAIREVGLSSAAAKIRQQAVVSLVHAGRDADVDNVGEVFRSLQKFNRHDFNEAARDSLRALFHTRPPHLTALVKVVGFAEVPALTAELTQLAGPQNRNTGERWAALISLARMGNPAAIQSIMQRAAKLPVNDDVVYDLFPDLIYTRQREALNYVATVLASEEKNCHTADAGSATPITCAYRVMEQLAPVVEGYPLRVDATGDIQTKDYNKALATCRKWWAQNGATCRINKEQF